MTAIGYCRMSREDQSLSVPAQRAAIQAWADKSGTVVTAWYADEGVSGGAALDKRPGLMDAIRALVKGDVLVVAKRDRLARDTVASALVERMAHKAGATVESADGVGNGDGPEAAFMRRIVDAVAEYERALIRARTKAALGVRKAQGLRVSRFPRFGYRHEDGRLVPDPKEQATLARYRELLASGLTRGRALRRLRAEGHTNRVGKPVTRAAVAG